jgi:CHC2 zinc finger
MTLLEYVVEQLTGPPARRSGGRSWWVCPFHNDHTPSFCTLPHNPKFKDRVRCFGCGFRGDVFDLLKEFHPDENFGDRLARVEKFQGEFRAEYPGALRGVGPDLYLFGDRGDAPGEEDRYSAAVSELLSYTMDHEELRVAQRVLAICCIHDVTPADLGWRVGREAEHIAETGAAFDECDRRQCQSIYCRMQQPDWAELAMRGERRNGD